MTRTIYLLILVLHISAYGQSSSKSNDKRTDMGTNRSVDSGKSAQTTNRLTKLDSIEKENNKSVIASGDNITKAFVSLDTDSIINLTANIRKDHRIFGYAKPDIKSERLLLLSVFTNDVENNPFGCKLGAYYETGRMNDLTLKYIKTIGNFVKAIASDKTNKSTIIYFEKKWIEFDEGR